MNTAALALESPEEASPCPGVQAFIQGLILKWAVAWHEKSREKGHEAEQPLENKKLGIGAVGIGEQL